MNEERVQQLIARWDAGEATAEEEAELERLLDDDASARQTFARHYVEEAELYGVLREADGYKQGQQTPLPSFSRDWRPRWLRSPGQAMVAAFLIMAMGGILFLSFAPAPQPVTVNGEDVSTLPERKQIEVEPDVPTVVRLPDGREITIVASERPESRAKPFFRMLAIAQEQVPDGIPIEAEIEVEDGSHLFIAEIVRGSQKIEVRVDPKTGEPRVGKPESVDSEDRVNGLTPAVLRDAVKKALEAQPGTVDSAKVRQRKGQYRAEVVINGDIGTFSVRVDLASGKADVKPTEVDHDDD